MGCWGTLGQELVYLSFEEYSRSEGYSGRGEFNSGTIIVIITNKLIVKYIIAQHENRQHNKLPHITYLTNERWFLIPFKIPHHKLKQWS